MFPENLTSNQKSPIGFHPKVVHLTCCFWTSCITWTHSVSWKSVVQIYGPSVHMTSYNKQLSVKWKVACFTVKIFKANICKGWLHVSECIIANDGEGWRDWPCTYGVCNRSLGRVDIPNDLLHVPQVFEYVHHKKGTNLFLWLICFLWLPILPILLLVLELVQSLKFVYLPKYCYQS
jgi:hypothetical protein